MAKPRERSEEEKVVARETADRLSRRGILVSSGDTLEQLGELQEAVEAFEAMVKRHGGDLMVDDLKSSQPDDSHFVLPRRKERESIPDYVVRINQATGRLRHHPPHTD